MSCVVCVLILTSSWLYLRSGCYHVCQVPDSDSSSCEEDALISALNNFQKRLTVKHGHNRSTHLVNAAHVVHHLMDAFPMENTGKHWKSDLHML